MSEFEPVGNFVVASQYLSLALALVLAPLMVAAFAPRPIRRAGHGMILFSVGIGSKSREASGRVDLSADNDNILMDRLSRPAPLAGQFGKRAFDICAALGLIILFAPLLMVTAIAIKLDSPGSVLYRQRRVGFEGREFEIFKFRSMRADAERDGARWAMKNDNRITRVGRFIRRTRIDEIPQALNVLRGEMSFVGPRPERPEFVRVLETEIPGYHGRHHVKPGITGWAQVKHEYTASVEGAREKLAYDLFYIKHGSFLLDFLIVLMTVRVALLGIGSR